MDLDFPAVYRAHADLDSLIQAAGRCNRNGESEGPVPVYLVACGDENLSMLREIRDAKTAALQLLSAFRRDPGAFDDDLASDAAINCYYKNLYGGMRGGAQDYPRGKEPSLFDLLSVNDAYAAGQPDMEKFGLHQAFQEAGAAFQVFNQDTTDVLVPYGEGAEIIAELGSAAVRQDWKKQKDLLERAKPYTVSLYQYQLELLEKQHGLTAYLDGAVLALNPEFYSDETGLTLEANDPGLLEV